MANKEHLKILKQGVEVWNQWREEHPDEKIDLSECNLTRGELSRVALRGTNLCKADLWMANLNGANLSKADLRGADLKGAILVEANLSGANLRGLSLSKADLSGANLSGADLRGTRLTQVDLVRTSLSEANITGAYLYGTARDGWKIGGIICDYVYWDYWKRPPKDRNFRPGEFEELYRSLPTFEYVFEHGFTPIDAVVMDRVVQAINEKHPEFELKLSTFDSRGQPHAVFTVVHKDHLEEAQQQVTTNFEQRLAALEGKQEQMMELFARIADNPKTIKLIMGDKRMIQAGRDYFEKAEGDVSTGDSSPEERENR